jgi:hypothetical protein
MIKPFLIFVSLLPFSLFSQDTLFNKRLSEITVKSTTKKETNQAVINIVRNNTSVSDGISVEYIKKTPDRTVGDALKRINGVSIQNDKFVLVRGLADRYNLAILNKNVLPSTEPDRRAFSFDIIPSSLIDNIIINKSATANIPGDFSGGLVQINTKDVSSNFLNVSLGSGWGSVSTSKGFKLVQGIDFPTTFPSTYTFRTANNQNKVLYTKLISNPDVDQFKSTPNLNGALSFGVKRDKLNLLFSGTARNSYTLNYIDRQDYQSSTELAYKYKDTSFSNVYSVNSLLNLTYLGNNRYSWKTLFNHQVDNSYLTRNGENYDNMQDVRTTSSNHIVKTVVNSQLDAKIKSYDLNLGYNLMLRNQPDYRVNPITKSLGYNEPFQTAWRDTYRFWSFLNEHSFNSSVNKQINQYSKSGVSYIKRFRQFRSRIFRYESSTMMNEITNNTDKYDANFDLLSGYYMIDKDYNNWKINTGLRTEYNVFNVQTSDFSGDRINVNKNYLDLLPSVNLSYNLDKTKYRVSLSRTLARPEFREISNFAYYDFVRNAQLLGNPKLEKSNIYNVDTKVEFYPKSGESISFGIFGKQFIKPIEQIVADGSVPSNLLLTFMNPDKALVGGLELELRKKINGWFDFYLNSSLINSQVKVNKIVRQLQGQSNYIVNSGVNLHKGKSTLNITYNRIGERISAVGFQGYPDIYENSRDVVDVVYLYKLKKGEVKLSIADILAQPSVYYQKPNRQLIKTNNEQTISLTLNLNL